MTRYVMAIDLRRCVGCQTCTAACKHANATPPGIQWRRVLDIETGEFPNVQRTFLPMACMHCANAPCEEVCPTTPKAIGTYDEVFTRWDGKTVTLNKPYMRPELCIGCGICQKECPVVDDAAVYVTAVGESRSDDRTLLLTGKKPA